MKKIYLIFLCGVGFVLGSDQPGVLPGTDELTLNLKDLNYKLDQNNQLLSLQDITLKKILDAPGEFCKAMSDLPLELKQRLAQYWLQKNYQKLSLSIDQRTNKLILENGDKIIVLDCGIQFIDAHTGLVKNSFSVQSHQVGQFKFTLPLSNGNIAVIFDKVVYIFDSNYEFKKFFRFDNEKVKVFNERLIYTNCMFTELEVYNLVDYNMRSFFFDSNISSIEQLSGEHLGVGLGNGTIVILDLKSGSIIKKFGVLIRYEAHSRHVSEIAELLNGNIATLSEDKVLKVWDYKTSSLIGTLTNIKNISDIKKLLDVAKIPKNNKFREIIISDISLCDLDKQINPQS